MRRVTATFETAGDARRAAERVRDAGLGSPRVDDTVDRAEALEGEMQDETASPLMRGEKQGLLMEGFSRALLFGLPGGVIGGVILGLLLGVLPFGPVSELSLVLRLAIGVFVGINVGTIVGFIGAPHFRQSEIKGEDYVVGDEPATSERGVVVGIDVRDDLSARRAAELFRSLGAERVDSEQVA